MGMSSSLFKGSNCGFGAKSRKHRGSDFGGPLLFLKKPFWIDIVRFELFSYFGEGKQTLVVSVIRVSSEQEVYGGILKLEMSVMTWCMDRSIVAVSFPFWNIAAGN
ncbi:hypothetical protein Ahy_B03g068779 isoform D [Arachis hypogaea]|uniref:Uncharacterized protein n=1 Tax=Arachis hypogaea TaxID=3818 RepID=A0A445AAV2_ARAHY|nr:hypothetical protein Ahy_B03g068779 isoform D [Arachis hypogaea]